MSIFDIASHRPEKGNKYFLDCNVLMYAFYINGGYATDLVYDYSSLISKIVNANAEILLTDVLISEFINTYIQAEFHRISKVNKLSRTKNYFKNTFKYSQEYSDILKELKIIITRQLSPVSTMVNVPFSEVCLDALFHTPETFDFNDRYYGYTMGNHSAYIVTNDADFSDITQCNILTRNAALLSNNENN